MCQSFNDSQCEFEISSALILWYINIEVTYVVNDNWSDIDQITQRFVRPIFNVFELTLLLCLALKLLVDLFELWWHAPWNERVGCHQIKQKKANAHRQILLSQMEKHNFVAVWSVTLNKIYC